MSEAKRRADLLEASRQAARRRQEKRRALDAEIRPPQAGDVYRLSRTADFDVEWVLIAQDPADPSRILVLPADGNSLVGSDDLRARSEVPRVLRCRHGGWIHADVLEGAPRLDVLDSRDLAAARHRSWALGDGREVGSVLEEDVDDDSEYQDWIEQVVKPAREALFATSGSPGVPAPPTPFPVPRPRRGRFPRRYALAASILVLVGAATAAAFLWRQQKRIQELVVARDETTRRFEREISALVTEHEREVGKIHAERGRLEQKLADTRAEAEAAESGLREQIAGLSTRLQDALLSPFALQAVAVPMPPSSRGTPIEISLQADTTHVVLLLSVSLSQVASPFRVTLREPDATTTIWASDALTPNDAGEIWLVLPRALLTRRSYELRMDRWQDDVLHPYTTYDLWIEGDEQDHR